MPSQDEHERLENLVQPVDLPVKPAETLNDEVSSNHSLEGYAAMNGLNDDEMGREAVRLEEERAQAARKG